MDTSFLNCLRRGKHMQTQNEKHACVQLVILTLALRLGLE
jgi:hypothetical protein